MTPVFIYALLDPRTGSLRYCGQTDNPDERLKRHFYPAKKDQHYAANWIRSLKRLGLKPIMEILDIVPDSEADFWEREHIQNFRERGFRLTNFSDGGHTPMRGKKHTSEACEKIRVLATGRKHTAETRAKMSVNSQGEKHHMFGKKLTPEHCAKISVTHLGMGHTPEARAKIKAKRALQIITLESIAKTAMKNTGQKRTPETREKMSRSSILAHAERALIKQEALF